MTSNEIRRQFLDFFKSRGHRIVDSSPVVPHDDPTLMFANAGMNQFKDVFLGTGSRPYLRVANTQKCIRAGGKHNDLDDVGRDTYHHTFFEMLGNWSFGDYFKKEAIRLAWELLTDVWRIPKDRLHATYFEGSKAEGLEPDTEAAELWRTVTDINPANVHAGGKKDNFWEMGDTGPCGPCSEIHVDLTPDKSGAGLVNAGDARVIEIWNLVFIQFNRDTGGGLTPLPARHVDTGMGFERLCALLQGMEQNRLGGVSNYDTDVFTPIFEAIRKRTGAPAYAGTLPADANPNRAPLCVRTRTGRREGAGRSDEDVGSALRTDNQSPERERRVSREQVMLDVSYRVIADHVRCLTFALTDGAIPSNEGRGYVLRRILRRAVRYGRQYMNMHEPFLCDLVQPLIEHMADAFPELKSAHGGKNVEQVTDIIHEEEGSFFRTIEKGLVRFEDAVRVAVEREITKSQKWSWRGASSEAFSIGEDDEPASMSTAWRTTFVDQNGTEKAVTIDTADLGGVSHLLTGTPKLSGGHAFRLHDTYGFPIDLTVLMAEERGLEVDVDEYERFMQEARDRARAAANSGAIAELLKIPEGHLSTPTDDIWKYHQCSIEATFLFPTGFVEEGGRDMWTSQGLIGLVFDKTCFYAEQGGQVGDQGTIQFKDCPPLRVSTTRRSGDIVIHLVDPRGVDNTRPSARGETAVLTVDPSHRIPTMQNHTSTHILNWALREVLGDHVQQKGSLVDPEKTRFDFSHNKPLTNEQLSRIEELCNGQIKADHPVYTKEVDQKKAREINTLRAVFGERYPDRVRVVSIGADIDEMLVNPKNEEWMKYSVEFCGGTHLQKSSEAECFVLTGEEGVAKGIRRVVGISGDAAKDSMQLGEKLLAEVRALADKPEPQAEWNPPLGGARAKSQQPKSSRGLKPAAQGEICNTDAHVDAPPSQRGDGGGGPDLAAALAALQKQLTDVVIPIRVRHEIQDLLIDLQRQVKVRQKQDAAASGEAVQNAVAKLLEDAETVGGVTVVVGEVPAAKPEALRSAVDRVRNKTDASAVLLACATDDKVILIAGMSKAVVKKGIRAGDLIREVCPIVGGRGGGRADMAQGGGTDPAKIGEALSAAADWVRRQLA